MTDRRGEPFFFYMSVILLLLVIGGFGSTLITTTDAVLSRPPVVHVHGMIFMSWFLLYLLQTRLIGSRNFVLHKRLGQLSIVLVSAMIVTGYLVTRIAFATPGWSISGLPPESSTIFPASDIVFFVIAFTLGLAFRANAAAHKRFMLLTGLLIMDPAIARLVINGLDGPLPLILLIELGLYVSIFVYDLRKYRRIHWATLIGFTLFVATTFLRMTQGEQTWWLSVSSKLFG
ncbi:hypothetical protein [Parasphingorhabdus sp.]|uniref:hypothetical protein n=1 Tax=Parasphingorhabdus sp. TaxID=2709688 RepID=UPI0032665B89